MPKPLQLLRDRYQLQKILGQNAGRQTWLALDTQSQNQVVVKLLTFSDRVQWDQVRLFEREAKILKYLDHLQIPQYRDFFCLDDQQLWSGLVQSYIPALSLKQRLEPIRKLHQPARQ
jgi:serine/threonine protein kinase